MNAIMLEINSNEMQSKARDKFDSLSVGLYYRCSMRGSLHRALFSPSSGCPFSLAFGDDPVPSSMLDLLTFNILRY